MQTKQIAKQLFRHVDNMFLLATLLVFEVINTYTYSKVMCSVSHRTQSYEKRADMFHTLQNFCNLGNERKEYSTKVTYARKKTFTVLFLVARFHLLLLVMLHTTCGARRR
jgi:hypothetical protein